MKYTKFQVITRRAVRAKQQVLRTPQPVPTGERESNLTNVQGLPNQGGVMPTRSEGRGRNSAGGEEGS